MSVTGDWSRGVTSAGTLEITFTYVRISSILSLLNDEWLIILVTHLLLFVKLGTKSWFNSNVLTCRRHGRSRYLFSSSVALSKHNLAKLLFYCVYFSKYNRMNDRWWTDIGSKWMKNNGWKSYLCRGKNEQICTVKFQNFLGAMPPDPHTGEGLRRPSQTLPPRHSGASRLRASLRVFGPSIVPLRV